MEHTEETPGVAIVGGGICGLTTALALEQRGLEPTVYEAASEYRPVGAGILLQTNALLVFERLGVVDRVRTDGVPLEDSQIRSPSGRVLKRFDLDRVERNDFGYGFVAIHRADLLRILLDELNTEVETGMACAAVTDTDTPTVRFADGTRVRPDVLVGADGIDSAVRDAVAPDVEPQAMDSVVYRAIATLELPEQYRTLGFEIWGEGTYTGGAPVDSDRFYWFATAPEQLAEDTADPRETTSALRDYVAAFPDPIPSIVESLDGNDVIVTELEDVPPLERWYRGSVVLAGDAAHGMLPFAGQGAAQAIEDALALAHSIDVHADQSAAFATYESERKPRADRIRSESERLGRLGTMQSNIGCRARNLAFGLLPDALFRRGRRRRVSGTWLPEAANEERDASTRVAPD
ncbi:zeaxanthin epoxidase [halophilic archaeon]|nr:zeaxanthin epoxidase [halophilic archaeon]